MPASYVLPVPGLEETEPHAPPPASPAPAPAPRRIGGYEVERELARGGMGVVYIARSVRLERRVALKVLRSGAHAAQDEVDRFLIEARAAARLKHPGIVAIHEVDHDGDVWFLAMDLIGGESLRAKITRDGPLAPRVAATVGRDVAHALQYAHERGVLHRDVKPHNVLIDGSGAAFLTDFGLAKEVEREGITVTGDILGTPAYMPPEQASGERARVDRRSDVYSLGATLYELVTGKPPFTGSTTLNVLRAVLEDEPVAPSRLRPGLDRDLETVILTCLAKEPTRRYDTCALLAADLERVLRDEPIRTRRPGLVERALRAARKHRRAVQSLSMALVTLVAVAVWVAVATERDQLARRHEEARSAADESARAYATLPSRSRAKLRAAQDALDAARRWHALAPADPAALRARSVAAFELGDQARQLEEWTSARDAYADARECGLDRARADAAVHFCEVMFDVRVHSSVQDYSRVLALLTSLIERPGCYDEAWLLRGAVLAMRGRREDGIADVSRVLDHDPLDTRALLSRASMFFELDRYADAARDLDRALAIDPLTPYGHQLRASTLRAQGDHAGALASIERLVEVDPDGASGWSLLGAARFELGDREGAHAAYRRGHQANPGDPRLTAELLSFALSSGDEGAAAALAESLGHAPAHDESVAVMLAQFRITVRRDPQGARAVVDEFLARHPASPRALAARAILRVSVGDLAGAASDADVAVVLAPRTELPLLARARVRFARGDLAGAEQDATSLVATAPARCDGYVARAEVREQVDDVPGFLADAERAFALEPGWPNVRLLRGRALLAAGRPRDAEAVFTDLIAEGKELLDARAGRAQARVLLSEFPAAVEDAEQARALAPDEPKLDLLLGEVRARAGDRAGAIVDLERYLSRFPSDDPGVARARELLEALGR